MNLAGPRATQLFTWQQRAIKNCGYFQVWRGGRGRNENGKTAVEVADASGEGDLKVHEEENKGKVHEARVVRRDAAGDSNEFCRIGE